MDESPEGSFKAPAMPPLTAKAFLKSSPKEKPAKAEQTLESAPIPKPEGQVKVCGIVSAMICFYFIEKR